MSPHSYGVVIPTRVLVTVYSADSADDAIEQAKAMLGSLDDRDVQSEMNGGHIYFEAPDFDDAPITAEHDHGCLCKEDDA